MLAGGISFFRLQLVGLAFAAIVAAVTYAFGEAIVPRAEKASELAILAGRSRNVVRKDIVFRMPKNGPVERILIAAEFDYLKGLMEKPTIIEFDRGKWVATFEARKGVWVGHRWDLQDLQFASGPYTGTATKAESFDPLEYAPRDILRRTTQPSEMNSRQLREYIESMRRDAAALRGADDSLERSVRRQRDLEIQYHLRMAMPVSCIAFALVGIPLGIRPRRASSSMSLGLAVLIVFGYYMFFNLLNLFGQRGILSPFVTAWLANAIAIAVGLGLSIERSK